MKRLWLINGSFRGEKAASLSFLDALAARLSETDFSIERFGMKSGRAQALLEDVFGGMARADALVLSFPLFVYTLPGGLLRFLEDFRGFLEKGAERNDRARLYPIVNCGFYDPHVTAEAIRVIRNFCTDAGFEYRFSVAIGCGPAAVATRKIPLLNRALVSSLARIAEDLRREDSVAGGDSFVRPAIPKAVLIKVKDFYENKSGVFKNKELS